MSLRLTILILLFVAAAPTFAQETKPVGLISVSDYPVEALRLGQQGEVRVRMRISTEGRVMACSVLKSASPSLDRTTCRILTQRARFIPATDPLGKATEGNVETTIRWVMPDKPVPPQRVRL